MKDGGSKDVPSGSAREGFEEEEDKEWFWESEAEGLNPSANLVERVDVLDKQRRTIPL